MTFRALRIGGLLLLGALAAVPATTADAAPAKQPQTNRSTTASATRRAPARKIRKTRRPRRGPKGVVYARNAIVVDPLTDRVLYQKNAEVQTPVASLTKLMTAQVFLEQKPDLRRAVEVTRAEIAGGGHTRLRNHEMVSLYDLFHMSLMCSDNVATRVLERESGLSHDEFVDHMNQKARQLGLTHTHFVEVTGLDERNVSCASDIAELLRAAAKNELICGITTTQSYVFVSGRRTHQLVNTNRLLKSRYEVNCGKTGFISESGYCVATWIRDRGHDLIAVVLGAPTNATRFADVVRLVQHTTTAGLIDTRQ